MSKEPSYVRCIKPNDFKRARKFPCPSAVFFSLSQGYKIKSIHSSSSLSDETMLWPHLHITLAVDGTLGTNSLAKKLLIA